MTSRRQRLEVGYRVRDEVDYRLQWGVVGLDLVSAATNTNSLRVAPVGLGAFAARRGAAPTINA